MTETIDFGPLMLLLDLRRLVSSPLRQAPAEAFPCRAVGLWGLAGAFALRSRTWLLTSAFEESRSRLPNWASLAITCSGVGSKSDPGRLVEHPAGADLVPNMVLPG